MSFSFVFCFHCYNSRYIETLAILRHYFKLGLETSHRILELEEKEVISDWTDKYLSILLAERCPLK